MPVESVSTQQAGLGHELIADFFVARIDRFLLTVTCSTHLKSFISAGRWFPATWPPCSWWEYSTNLVSPSSTAQCWKIMNHWRILFLKMCARDNVSLQMTRWTPSIYIYIRIIIYMNYLPMIGSLHLISHCLPEPGSSLEIWHRKPSCCCNTLSFSGILCQFRRLFGNLLEVSTKRTEKMWDACDPINCEVCVYLDFYNSPIWNVRFFSEIPVRSPKAQSQTLTMSSCHSPKSMHAS